MENVSLCPKFETAFEILGKKWTGLIIMVLMKGPRRFCEIRDVIPELSDRMLTERFKELEKMGIIKRSVYPETPVRIEYELTEKGFDLKSTFEEIQKWSETWINL
ncbi:MAG: helix-turn-helix transcriptional regulator [Clostridiaceae bacterium]|nr:helix-turn-helix transcriptional regulator [Clostridiaceae bacterium]